MQTPNLPPYTFRNATLADIRPVHELYLLSDAHDQRFWVGSLADTESEFTDPVVDPASDCLLAHAPDGSLAGVVWALPRPASPRVFLWPDIHPGHRATGLDDVLMIWAVARARTILASHEESPRYIRSSAPANEAYRIDLLHRHGLRPARYFFEMRRDLSQPIDDARLSAGLRMVTWSPERDAGAFDAFNDSFQDHWDFTPVNEDEWRRYFVGRDSFRGDLSYLVLDGEEVVAISTNYYSPEENERKGVDEAWIGDLGVRRAWRRQGVATALLNRSMRAFKAAGIAYASLGVDSENPTGALGVYRRVGFEVMRQSISFRLEV